jgi:hypothetical protein
MCIATARARLTLDRPWERSAEGSSRTVSATRVLRQNNPGAEGVVRKHFTLGSAQWRHARTLLW